MNDEPQISTKDRPGVYDAIETAKPGEPLFPIQGGDPFGPSTVQFWVDQCRRAGMREEDPVRARELLEKASSAEHVVWAMQEYQRGVVAEAQPEGTPAPAKPSYSNWTDPADAETKQARAIRASRIEAAQMLSQAVSVASEAVEMLKKNRVCPEAEAAIREALEAVRAAAMEVEPRRGRERT